MKKFSCRIKLVIVVFLSLIHEISFAQNTHYKRVELNKELKEVLKDSNMEKLMSHIDTLFLQIARDSIDNKSILAKNADLTISVLRGLRDIENNKQDSLSNYYKKQLINFYPIVDDTYVASIAFISNGDKDTLPILKTIFTLIATHKNGNTKFSLPITYHTKDWKSAKLGNITYIYKDTIQAERAHKFDKKNTAISKKLNVPTEQFTMYMCKNYQEILKLLGYDYDLKSAGSTIYGHGVDRGYIFSIINNEDFSHDVFHYYSGKINKREDRNWITEEGIACSWGNAYYTDKNGEMIENKRLINELKRYLQKNEKTDLLNLFENNTEIFSHLAPELSVRSTISGLLMDEVERKKGMEGLLKMINCGRQPNSIDSYFKALNSLLGINKFNFNSKVNQLLEAY